MMFEKFDASAAVKKERTTAATDATRPIRR
jgi:hypothetical protein